MICGLSVFRGGKRRGSWVKLRWEEVPLDVGQVATVTLLEVIRLNQLLEVVLIIVAVDEQLFICELVDEFVG